MPDLTLTPLGTSPAWYNPGESSSGYLLQSNGFRILIDCGSGVVSRYLEIFGTETPIDAICITHVHPDHCFDLVPLKYGMDYGSLSSWAPQLWLPPGAHERLQTLASAWDGTSDFFSSSYKIHTYKPTVRCDIGPFTFNSIEVPHFIQAFAFRFESDGASFGFSSDLGPCQQIAPFMSDVDLFLCEATLNDAHHEPETMRGHLTAFECGEIARDAGVHSLLLTHIPMENNPQRTLKDVASVYGGPVALAESGQTYSVALRLAQAV